MTAHRPTARLEPRTARTDPSPHTGANGQHGANGRPPPLPHEVASAVRRPAAQAVERPQRPPPRVRTQPVDLDVLPPQIKASLEKLAGGLNRNPPPSGGPPPKSDPHRHPQPQADVSLRRAAPAC